MSEVGLGLASQEAPSPSQASAELATGTLNRWKGKELAQLQSVAGNRNVGALLGPRSPTEPHVESLPAGLRADLERKFGERFDNVRIHRNARAGDFAQKMGAEAMTVGNHIWVESSRYRPETEVGRRLLAHELAHVIQQRRGGPHPIPDLGGRHEVDAVRASGEAAAGHATVRVNAASKVGIARQTAEDLARLKMIQQANEQMKLEGLHKNLVGAAGEGAYMGSLTSRGVPNINLNDFTPGMNAPYLDVVSGEGVAQLKVRGSTAQPSKSALRSYRNDFIKLTDPEMGSQGIARGIANAKKAAQILSDGRADLIKSSAWPKGLDANANEEQILDFMRKESMLAIPADHVAAVRQNVAEYARVSPEMFGLKPGPNLEADIAKLTERIQSIGLSRQQLGVLERDFRAGTPTTSLEGTTETTAVEVKPLTEQASTTDSGSVGPSHTGDTATASSTPTTQIDTGGSADPTGKIGPTGQTEPTGKTDPGSQLEPTANVQSTAGGAPETLGIRARIGRFGGFASRWGGRALAAWSAWSEYKNLKNTGHGTPESLVGGGANLAGGLAVPGLLKSVKGAGPIDLAINLANLGLNAAGAPQGVTDVSSTIASGTPSSFITSTLSSGARAYFNIGGAIAGDASGIDRQVKEMQKGEVGAPLQGYALTTELVTELATGKDLESSLMKVGSIGKDSSAARIGNTLGDSAWVLSNVGQSLAHGDSLETAVMKAPHMPAESKWIEDAGNKMGDEAYRFVNKDLPEAKEFVKKDVARIANTAKQKLDAAEKAVVDTEAEVKRVIVEDVPATLHQELNAAADYARNKYDNAVDAASDKLRRAKEVVGEYLPW